MDRRGMLAARGIKTGCLGAHCLKYGFLEEQHFRRMLIAERKRTERSKRPFVLVLINIEALLDKLENGFKGIHALMKVFHERVRETDILGWYEQHKIMGVIYTETDVSEKSVLQVKVQQALNNYSGLVEYKLIIFPSEELKEGSMEYIKFYHQDDSDGKKKMIAAWKRIIDMTSSLLIILLLLPLFLVIAVLIKFSSPGPVFFRQQRIGDKGKLFTFLKFRSMYVNSDDMIHRQYVTRLIKGEISENEGVFKITDDPRVTAVGKILRKTSLDELPQFFNVLKGDMALVGPRPPIPYELAAYQPWHFRRFMECKPGITGLWQVEGRSKTTFDGMVRMDIRYSRYKSFLGDLKLLLKTPAALLFAKGAY
jgi:lipopolysaccharide/colanic/teichoic acid biosynthesis glycosyltransferase